MSELYKGVEKLQNKHYEEAAKDLYEFILKDKLTTNIDDAIKGWKEKDKLHLSNNELIEFIKILLNILRIKLIIYQLI